ncbi:MAG: transglycosylase SLT domain-containing protein [Fibrobacter sp.]|nr:transglycosylase SLT domain-containing protein [Fibrobacter sp.]
MSFYYLEITRGIEKGKRYLLNDGAISVGRSSQNNIAFHSQEKNVSGHHAIIYKSPERILIQDLVSTNGTFINEVRITEQYEIRPGDELGFGKDGPRAKLITSETPLDTSPQINSAEDLSQVTTSIKTREEAPHPIVHADDFTCKEDQKAIFKMKHQQLSEFSLTGQFENKIVSKNLDSDDMKKLLNDGKRLEKIIERGNMGTTETHMLRNMYLANKTMKRQWQYLIGIIIFISLSVISFFAIRAYQYKQLGIRAQNIRKTLDEYEKRISEANVDPDQNKDKLDKLINEFEEQQKSYNSIKGKIKKNDFEDFVSVDPLERKIDEVLSRFGETDYHIPKEMVVRVRYHIDIYSGRMKGIISRYMERRNTYFPMINKIFREKNIPVELAYVSMLESGFNPVALSHAGARGLWQFMPHTGRRFGLIINDTLDERIIPEKATVAAAEYFKELIAMFGGKSSVMLCMAAYNAGEGRIFRALKKIDDPMRNRDFWYIYRMGYLAEETNEYIPRVIALIILTENQKEYGFGTNGKAPSMEEQQPVNQENDFVEVKFSDEK